MNVSSTLADAAPVHRLVRRREGRVGGHHGRPPPGAPPVGVDVVLVECGPVRTPAWETAGEHVTEGSDPTTRSARERWNRLTTLAEPTFADPADVGSLIAEAVLDENPRTVYRIGPGSRLDILTRLLPARLTDLVSRTVFGLGSSPNR